MLSYVFLIVGFLLLIFSGDFLVKGAVSIALKLRLSTLVIGMTIVSFGTSAPELLVSIKAALGGHPDISIGSVVGSNISNIALILGITALVFPITVSKATLRIDWPMMMLSTLLFVVVVMDGELSAWEGILFIVFLISFIVWLIRNSRKGSAVPAAVDEVNEEEKNLPLWKGIGLVGLGVVGLVLGADLMLKGAVEIARYYDVSERIIGLTIVAFGTSLPELITSCVAAFRKEADISIGNLIGSNIFNILAILGITSIIHPISVSSSIINSDNYILLGITFLVFPLMYFGKKLTRAKGLLLFFVYAAYLIYLIV
ncbi:calcium/sodium antiporter [Vicingaceae bacterium]|nr:calcium/sodium antiporter [Vicingaceae bacterium]